MGNSQSEEDDFYFFEQTKQQQGTTKRYRKMPDDLPEELKFAHLHPRVAALLAQKDRENLQKIAEQDPFGDGLGKKSLLPNINQAVTHIKNRLDSALSNDEDSQRYLFEDSKASSVSVLEQLARYLYYYDNIVSIVPKSLEYQLMSGWKELTSDVNYIPREWQTSEVRDQYYNSLREAHSDEESDGETKQKSEKVGETKSKTKKGKPSIPEITEEEYKEKPPKRSDSRQSAMSVSKGRLDVKPSGGRLSREHRGSITGLRSPSMRKVHDDMMSNIGETPSDQRSTAMANPAFIQQTSINFSLTSKTCEEKGWIVLKGDEESIDRKAILTYCIELLGDSITRTKAQQAQDKERGHDKSASLRYYGDYKRETLLKYRKSPVKQQPNPVFKGGKPRIPSLFDDKSEGRKLMQAVHQDGTTVVYYPSGRMAVVYCSASIELGRPGYYLLAYDDTPENRMLACFTPSGRGVCYASNGVVRFLATEKGGQMADLDGSVTRKWKWPSSTLKAFSPLNVQLNNHIVFRCNSQVSMHFLFSCQNEMARLNVSPVPGAIESKAGDENEQLLTTFTFTSRAAKDLMRIFAPKTKQRNKKPARKQASKGHTVEIQKLLEFHEKEQPENESDRDLQRLQRRAMLLVDNWIEHYRHTIGLRSPYLDSVSEYPNVSLRRVQCRSARLSDSNQRRIQLGLEVEETSRAMSAPLVRDSGEKIEPEVIKSGKRSGQKSARMSAVKFDNENQEAGGEDGTVSPTAVAVLERLSQSAGKRSARSIRTSLSSAPPSRQHTALVRADTSLLMTKCPCPIALRQIMVGKESPGCRCSKHIVPQIMDIEYDSFIQNEAPSSQTIVVAVASSLFPTTNASEMMITSLYCSINRNRTKPCHQGKNDSYRILQYDINTAAEGSDHTQPLLLTRHNVVPGMFLIYRAGKLLFCDHIFNGYGNAKKDFKKQIMKSQIQAIQGFSLPTDFKFSPSRGRSGMRSAWGGEIGGTGVDNYGSPGTSLESGLVPLKRSVSSLSDDSKLNAFEHVKRLDAAAFISLSLSPGGYKPAVDIKKHFSATNQLKLQETVT